jgi:hypothetical protein
MTIDIRTPIPFDNRCRVLLQIRPSLLTPLIDCPELDQELRLQASKPLGTKWRSEYVSLLEGLSKTRHIMEPSPVSSLCANTILGDSDTESLFGTLPSLLVLNFSPGPSQLLHIVLKESAITSPLKKWPFDRYTCEIHDGWDKINQMMAEDPKMTQ